MSQHTWLPGNEQYSAMLSLTLVVSHDGSHVHKNVTCKHCMLVIQTSILMFCIGCLLQYGNSHIYFILQIRAMTCDLILIHARNTGAWSNACHSQRLVVAVFPKFRNSVRKQRQYIGRFLIHDIPIYRLYLGSLRCRSLYQESGHFMERRFAASTYRLQGFLW